MTKIYGMFASREDAADAFDRLGEIGYMQDDISVIAVKQEETRGGARVANAAEPTVASRTTGGVVTGGVIGGLAGFLIGIGAIAIPGIGAVLIGGPIAAALGLTGAAAATATGAITGAVAGGLLGALTSIGIPEDRARVYEERIRSGGVLLGVEAADDKVEEIRNIMSSEGAADITTVA